MTYEREIRRALVKPLKAAVHESLLSRENRGLTPDDETPWVREKLLPGIPERVELMKGGRSRQRGVYQIDVFTPCGIGTDVSDSLVEVIGDQYDPGEAFESAGVVVVVLRTYARSGREDGKWYHRPLVIEWEILEE